MRHTGNSQMPQEIHHAVQKLNDFPLVTPLARRRRRIVPCLTRSRILDGCDSRRRRRNGDEILIDLILE